MSIIISPETEARLTDEARRQGISVDALLERLMAEHQPGGSAVLSTQAEAIEHARKMIPGGKLTPELPVLHLGAMGPLHRRDIYDDVR
ncbi:MAG: hypothetical protein ABSF71_12455 [Terriglobia bacterium]|jgi:hypothetical protein